MKSVSNDGAKLPESRMCELLIAKLPVAMIVVGIDGRIRISNESAARTLGSSREYLEGRDVAEVLGPLPVLLAGIDQPDPSLDVSRPDGSELRLGFSISKVDLGDGTADNGVYAIVIRDITRSARVAVERDRLLRLASMGAAAPTIIHEVKNSLAALTLGLELLEHCPDLSSVQTQAHAMLAEARNIATTLDGFGAVGRELRTESCVDLMLMLIDARRLLAARALRCRISLEWNVASLPKVKLDPAVVHALLFNLATNAFRACSPGGTVRIYAAVVRGRFVLRVADSGAGMTPEVARRCTELFFSTAPRGSGIGLALCKDAVDSAGGTLQIRTRPGAGTIFTIEIPDVADAAVREPMEASA